jgi:hypothetical protein
MDGKIVSTHNLVEQGKKGSVGREESARDRGSERKKREGTLERQRFPTSGGERKNFILDFH